MKTGLVIYDSIDTISGGYLYDRQLVSKLREQGDMVEVISIRRRSYAANLLDNLAPRDYSRFDLLLQDELGHPSLFLANRRPHSVPIVSIVHHLRSSERRPWWQNALYRSVETLYVNSVDGFIFNSPATRASVERITRQAKPGIVAAPGGDRLGQSTEEDVKRRARSAGPLRLVFLGAVTPGKGVEVLLDALARLPRDDCSVEVVGSMTAAPGFSNRMRRKAAELQLRIQFSGQLEEAGIEARLRSAHVMVLPSYYEGFGIAILEGMAHGLPALATRVGAIPQLVQEGADGFLVNPGDAVALSERIALVGRDRGRLEILGLAALAKFRSSATWDQSTDRIREFLLAMPWSGQQASASEREAHQ